MHLESPHRACQRGHRSGRGDHAHARAIDDIQVAGAVNRPVWPRPAACYGWHGRHAAGRFHDNARQPSGARLRITLLPLLTTYRSPAASRTMPAGRCQPVSVCEMSGAPVIVSLSVSVPTMPARVISPGQRQRGAQLRPGTAGWPAISPSAPAQPTDWKSVLQRRLPFLSTRTIQCEGL